MRYREFAKRMHTLASPEVKDAFYNGCVNELAKQGKEKDSGGGRRICRRPCDRHAPENCCRRNASPGMECCAFGKARRHLRSQGTEQWEVCVLCRIWAPSARGAVCPRTG